MPYITFLWYPRSDHFQVAGIAEDLRAIADAHNVGFYVNVKEEEEEEPVVVHERVTVPSDVVARLGRLAKRAGVTIYVNPPDPLPSRPE